MAQRSPRFKGLIAPIGGQKTASPIKSVGKSKDPAYVQLYAYVRRETHTELKIRLMKEGREISEIVQELLDNYLYGPPSTKRQSTR
jgi:hypothetical protein